MNQTPQAAVSSTVERLVRTRDGAILRLWAAFRDMSDELPADEWTDADLELWGKVTEHEAVQSRLHIANAQGEFRRDSDVNSTALLADSERGEQ